MATALAACSYEPISLVRCAGDCAPGGDALTGDDTPPGDAMVPGDEAMSTCPGAELPVPGTSQCAEPCGTALCVGEVSCVSGTCSCLTGYQDDDDDGTCLVDCTSGPPWFDTGCVGCVVSDGIPRCTCNGGENDDNADFICDRNPTTCGGFGTLVGDPVRCACKVGYQDRDDDLVCTPDCTIADPGCKDFEGCTSESGTPGCTCVVYAMPLGTGTGTSWLEATGLKEAIDFATYTSPGCEVWVGEGVYIGDLDLSAAGGVAIYGGFGGTEIAREQRDPQAHEAVLTVSASSSLPVVTMTGVTGVTLDGFVITGAAGGAYGGGLSISASYSIVLRNLRIVDNSATNGAGIYADQSSSLTLEGVVVSRNHATGNGAG